MNAEERATRMDTPGQDGLLQLVDLKTYFPVRSGVFSKITGYVKAVDGVSLSIPEGKTFGLVGESGCGKSTLGKTALRLIEPTAGKILFHGQDISSFQKRELKQFRKEVQMIFQDPYSSLNPRMTVRQIISEPLEVHHLATGKEKDERILELMELVGLASYQLERYPHEFSGGQRQRIGIARALAVNPKLIICDEPVSALDVSIQSQILNLLSDLQEQLHLTYLFIAHGIAAVRYISDVIGVMYLGHMVEVADAQELCSRPLHPYTKALMSAVPTPDPHHKKARELLKGDVPSPIHTPAGCCFHTRCPYATSICTEQVPQMEDLGNGHTVACHLIRAGASKEVTV